MSDTDGKQNPKHEDQEPFHIHKTSDLIINMDITDNPKMNVPNNNIIENKPKNEIPVIKMLNTRPEENKIKEHTTLEIENNVEMVGMDENSENNGESGKIENKDTYVIMRVYDTYYNQEQYPQQQYQKPMYQQPGQYYGGYAPSYGEPLSYDPSTRNTFVKCVLIIVLIMLVLTAAFITFVLASEDAKEFFQTHGMGLMLPAT
ncbi:uncharacterized protein [Epargyreus clarus]|uniref:uncharacterized protein n=1 Tax=Epargyreus clarus TaxID=520877 RepID=UPI003C2E9539